MSALATLRTPGPPERRFGPDQSDVDIEAGLTVGRLRRALDGIEDRVFVSTVVADLIEELAVVGRAERGDLTGRARQASTRTRDRVIPEQVDAVLALLWRSPLGGSALGQECDPCSGAMAAVGYLLAAARAVDVSQKGVWEVLASVEDASGYNCDAALVLTERVLGGESAQDAVLALLSEAVCATDGSLPDAGDMKRRLRKADACARRIAPGDRDIRAGLLSEVRVTVLDPRRPAPQLIEELLAAIAGCYELWLMSADYEGVPYDSDDEAAIRAAECLLEARFWAEV